MRSPKAAAAAAGAVAALVSGALLAAERPPDRARPPSSPAPPPPKPAAPESGTAGLPESQASPFLKPTEPEVPAWIADVRRKQQREPPVISGRVVDEEGNPIRDVSVKGPLLNGPHHCVGSSQWCFEARTDGAGEFQGVMECRPPPKYRRYLLDSVCADGYEMEMVEAGPGDWASLDAGRSVWDLRVVLLRRTFAEVTVIADDGEWVPEAEVVVRREEVEDDVWTQSDSNGVRIPFSRDTEAVVFARFCGWESARVELRGRLRPGETTPVTLEIHGFLPGKVAPVISGGSEGEYSLHFDGESVVEGFRVLGDDPPPPSFSVVAGAHLAEVVDGEGRVLARDWLEIPPRGVLVWSISLPGEGRPETHSYRYYDYRRGRPLDELPPDSREPEDPAHPED